MLVAMCVNLELAGGFGGDEVFRAERHEDIKIHLARMMLFPFLGDA